MLVTGSTASGSRRLPSEDNGKFITGDTLLPPPDSALCLRSAVTLNVSSLFYTQPSSTEGASHVLSPSVRTSTPSLNHACALDPSSRATRHAGRARSDESLFRQACAADQSYGTEMEYFQHQCIIPLNYNLSSAM